ncbi:hypothetical protein [Dyadobacter beijingensis]|uniref:hypothetical protein n=1 Tax=Dyadobacter beijingensis TaxID=365489 RepID=UPI001E48B179|nr:hypothetical protein [Dyadobacter beijingensis]
MFLNVLVNVCAADSPDKAQASQAGRMAPYRFPEFGKGTVYFRNGTRREAFLNYHRIQGQMQFLSLQADTMLFTGKYLIDRIETAGRTFLLTEKDSDMEVIDVAGDVMLAARTQSEAAGNGLSHSGQHYSASAGEGSPGLLVSNREGNFQWQNNASGQPSRVKTTYFLMDRNRIVRPASRRTFLTVYARHRRGLARYMSRNRIDYNNEADLRKLIGFCAGLTGTD